MNAAATPHAALYAGHHRRQPSRSPRAVLEARHSLAQWCTSSARTPIRRPDGKLAQPLAGDPGTYFRLSRTPHDARATARAPVMMLAEAMRPSGRGQVRQKACRERPYAGKPRTEVGVTARRDGTDSTPVGLDDVRSRGETDPLNVPRNGCRMVPANGPTQYTPERGLSALQARSQSHAAGTVREPTRVHQRALVGWPRYDDEVAAISQSCCHLVRSSRRLYARPARGNGCFANAAPPRESIRRHRELPETAWTRVGPPPAPPRAGAASSSHPRRRRRPGPQPVLPAAASSPMPFHSLAWASPATGLRVRFPCRHLAAPSLLTTVKCC